MRYIGSKVKIVDQIDDLIKLLKIDKENYTFFDAFSGTATVGNHFKDKFKIIANDTLFSSYVLTQAKLNTPDKKFRNLTVNPFDLFNDTSKQLKGFVYNNYSLGGSERMYFSEENAARIDFIRTKIEDWYKSEKIDSKEYYYFIIKFAYRLFHFNFNKFHWFNCSWIPFF